MGVCEFCCTHTDTLPCKSYGKIQYPSQDFCQFARGLNPYGYRDGMGRGGVAMEGVLQGIPGVMVLGILPQVRILELWAGRRQLKFKSFSCMCDLSRKMFQVHDLQVKLSMSLNDGSLIKNEGFPFGSVVKNQPANAGDSGSIPGSGRLPGEGNGSPLQCS